MISRERVIEALSQVMDPDLQKDLITLGMIENLRIENKNVYFRLVLTTPACPLKEQIKQACLNAIHIMVDKQAEVQIEVTSKVTTKRADATVLKGVKNIIAIASGKGGVGKSTLAVNLAITLQKLGSTVGILDADIYGPSIPTMFGVYDAPEMVEVDGRSLMQPIEKEGIKLLSIGFLLPPGQAVVWRGPMISSAIRQFMNDVNWGNLDYLIIDLPPGTGDIHLTLAQQFPVTGVVIITTPQELALADARKAVAMFHMQGVSLPIIGVVENMSYFVPDDAPDKKYYLFGSGGGQKLADEYNLPLLAQIPMFESIRANADNGKVYESINQPINNAFLTFAQNVAQKIAVLNSLNNQSTING
jgi:ATP-binding protein involved in chromosome partitioning